MVERSDRGRAVWSVMLTALVSVLVTSAVVGDGTFGLVQVVELRRTLWVGGLAGVAAGLFVALSPRWDDVDDDAGLFR